MPDQSLYFYEAGIQLMQLVGKDRISSATQEDKGPTHRLPDLTKVSGTFGGHRAQFSTLEEYFPTSTDVFLLTVNAG